jgi:hypothetical protein
MPRLLSKRFGRLNTGICKKIEALSIEDLEHLADDFLSFTNIDDLMRWLGNKSH